MGVPFSLHMQMRVVLSGCAFQLTYANENNRVGMPFSLHMLMNLAPSGRALMTVDANMNVSESVYGNEN